MGVCYSVDNQAAQQVDKLSQDLEEITEQMRDIQVVIKETAQASEGYKKQAAEFEKVVDVYIEELGICSKLKAIFDQMKVSASIKSKILEMQRHELEKCEQRVSNSTIDQMVAEDFFNSIRSQVQELVDLADVSVPTAEALEYSRKSIESKIEFWRSVANDSSKNAENICQNLNETSPNTYVSKADVKLNLRSSPLETGKILKVLDSATLLHPAIKQSDKIFIQGDWMCVLVLNPEKGEFVHGWVHIKYIELLNVKMRK